MARSPNSKREFEEKRKVARMMTMTAPVKQRKSRPSRFPDPEVPLKTIRDPVILIKHFLGNKNLPPFLTRSVVKCAAIQEREHENPRPKRELPERTTEAKKKNLEAIIEKLKSPNRVESKIIPSNSDMVWTCPVRGLGFPTLERLIANLGARFPCLCLHDPNDGTIEFYAKFEYFDYGRVNRDKFTWMSPRRPLPNNETAPKNEENPDAEVGAPQGEVILKVEPVATPENSGPSSPQTSNAALKSSPKQVVIDEAFRPRTKEEMICRLNIQVVKHCSYRNWPELLEGKRKPVSDGEKSVKDTKSDEDEASADNAESINDEEESHDEDSDDNEEKHQRTPSQPAQHFHENNWRVHIERHLFHDQDNQFKVIIPLSEEQLAFNKRVSAAMERQAAGKPEEGDALLLESGYHEPKETCPKEKKNEYNIYLAKFLSDYGVSAASLNKDTKSRIMAGFIKEYGKVLIARDLHNIFLKHLHLVSVTTDWEKRHLDLSLEEYKKQVMLAKGEECEKDGPEDHGEEEGHDEPESSEI